MKQDNRIILVLNLFELAIVDGKSGIKDFFKGVAFLVRTKRKRRRRRKKKTWGDEGVWWRWKDSWKAERGRNLLGILNRERFPWMSRTPSFWTQVVQDGGPGTGKVQKCIESCAKHKAEGELLHAWNCFVLASSKVRSWPLQSSRGFSAKIKRPAGQFWP